MAHDTHRRTPTPPPGRLLRRREVLAKIPISATTMWRLRSRGRFPAPIQLTPGLLAWTEADIDLWIEERRQRGDRK